MRCCRRLLDDGGRKEQFHFWLPLVWDTTFQELHWALFRKGGHDSFG